MKLHLGCGHIILPGFIHIDIDDHPHLDYRQDASDLSIFDDNSVEVIYASHVLAYFDREQVKEVLAEWKRVLVPGGKLRLADRDFAALSAIYQKYGQLEKLLGYFYALDKINGKPTYLTNIYDYEYLKSLLKNAGFTKIHHWDSSQTSRANYPDCSQALFFPTPEKGILISLNLECIKP
ncbi:hypothetical protein A2865_04685 [Candidatus Woesebacteria bacterium RIFCSPHIGHO2_01_FULL_39_17]|uniref:Methyltransferase family protein n=2 Tax=Candidatus Woeseibacteriota TaxID=1752722 RepID=A0A0G0NCY9_9BACT|nr:MAG: Methyltransferase family protein [Candidatus Woesebacteria bacterium GW2011_GWB1_39_10b]KKR13358.1 MAG: Methyltransferase family protein [Candidatus Woesebacteria bacterium GW2011_GWA1_39_21b]KKS89688.1 MAG: Methyltransferase family protein [Parcubacteria group bacterium GW2011_GWC1_43_11b]OGM24315.1 MAG: hypothetical protein A2865_04685 [Candidatus Woesebacteria bacterium RIFCSPHIGHO2_01_FULL_39_17]